MIYFIVFSIVLVADQLSKLWVVNNFNLYDAKEIIPGLFNLVYVTNTGAAFSMFADVDSPWRHYFFVSVSSIAIVGLTIAGVRLRKINKVYVMALALIAGGAAGNLVDRLRMGAVVDFLDFYAGGYHWPAFNVADSGICIGACLFLLINFNDTKKTKQRLET